MSLQFKGSSLLRALLLMSIYSVVTAASIWLSYQLRFDFTVDRNFLTQLRLVLSWIIPLKLILLLLFGQFAGLLSYFSIPDLRRLFFAMLASSGIILGVWFQTSGVYAPPRSVILADFLISLMSLASARLGFRLVREHYLAPHSRARVRQRRVGIVGAGDVGANLAKELISKRGLGLNPVAFFDDDKGKWQSRIHDVPVVGAPEALLDGRLNLQLEEVIIAMPSASAKRIGEVVRVLQQTRLRFETVPSLDQLATGKVKVSQLRSIQIQDLLGREPVKLETENISQVLRNRVIMVTGAGGSIGSELSRQIASFNPQRLLLVEQSEFHAFQIEQEMVESGYGGIILPLIADILDLPRMRNIFQRFHPHVIFHAAAHKHVPMMETQPGEAIKNNTLGTIEMARLAQEYQADRFVLISTDKAINPTSVMGATKRLAEIFLQSLHGANPNGTKMMAVRFGNVLGSSGSVIPTFNKQIAAGGPVRVTHPDISRYFMTIPEASGLVLQSAAQGSGGEIFVLDMGEPIKIVDLARQLIELSGLRPEEDIEIQFVGLRPGEKLFEELSYQGENITSTHHPKIMRFVCEPASLDEIEELIGELKQNLYQAEPAQLKAWLKKGVPEYQPYMV